MSIFSFITDGFVGSGVLTHVAAWAMFLVFAVGAAAGLNGYTSLINNLSSYPVWQKWLFGALLGVAIYLCCAASFNNFTAILKNFYGITSVAAS